MQDTTGDPVVSRVTSDQATANTTATAVPGLNFDVGANEVWEFSALIRCQKSTGTAGIKYAVSVPSGATIEAMIFGGTSATTAFGTARINASATLTSVIFNILATTDMLVWIEGVVANGATPGTVQVQQASVTSGNATVFTNSYIRACRIA